MKKFFFCAAAAIVALASCSKTEVINNDLPSEIGFKAITGVMTKAPITAFGNDTNMGVWADYKADGSSTYGDYFSDFEFHKYNGSWAGWSGGAHSPKYYPVSGTLDFLAYSPKAGNVTPAERENCSLDITYTMTNNKTAQTDFLVSQIRSGVTKPNSATDVALAFKHALSLIDINVKKSADAAIVIKSITLTGTNHAGTAEVVYDENRTDEAHPTITWTATDAAADDNVTKNLSLTDEYADYNNDNDLLVVPTATTTKTIKVVYTIDGGIDLFHTIELENSGKWLPSYKYTYNITVGLTEITIDPSIDDWETPDPAIPDSTI